MAVDVWRDDQHLRQWADWELGLAPLHEVGLTTRHGTQLRIHLDSAYFGPGARLPADVPAAIAELFTDDPVPAHVDLSIVDHRYGGPLQ